MTDRQDVSMIQFKVRERIVGVHHELTVFERELPTETWAMCGKLAMSPCEAQAFRNAMGEGVHEWELPV